MIDLDYLRQNVVDARGWSWQPGVVKFREPDWDHEHRELCWEALGVGQACYQTQELNAAGVPAGWLCTSCYEAFIADVSRDGTTDPGS